MLNRIYSYFFNKANNLRSTISKKEGEAPWRVRTFSVLELFFLELMEDVFKLFILLFKNPYDSFQLFTKQETLPICEYSYTDHRRFQKKVRLFSLAGLSSIISATIIINLILSLIIPGQIPSYAKTVNGGWDDWSLTNLANDPPMGSAGSLTIDPSPSSGLSNLWHMNNSWNDSAGSVNLTASGGAGFGTAKLGSNSGSFDGADDYASASMSASFSAVSVGMWVKTTSVNWQSPVNIESTGGFYMSKWTEGRIFFMADGSSGNNTSADESTIAVNDGNWHHIVGTNDGTTTRVYIDGSLNKSYAETIAGTATAIKMGWSTGGSAYYNGSLDEVFVYNRALSENEVSQLYAASYGVEVGSSAKSEISGTGNASTLTLKPSSYTATDDGVFSTTGAATMYQNSVQNTSGLVSYWKMDNSWDDSKGTNHATRAGSGTPFGAAKYGSSSGSFNGSNDYLSVPGVTNMNFGTGDFAVELWANFSSTASLESFFFGSDSSIQIGFNHPTVALNKLYIYTGGTTAATVTSSFTLGAWYQITFARQSGMTRFYVNGSQIGDAVAFTGATNLNGTLAIGNIGGYLMNGLLDEVAIYNRALSSNEISSHYAQGFYMGTLTSTAVTGAGASVKLGYTVVDDGNGNDGPFDPSLGNVTGGCDSTKGMTWSSPTCTINTSNATYLGTYNFTTISIPAGTTLTTTKGNNLPALILKAKGAVTISGTIDLNASGNNPGPAGYSGGTGASPTGTGSGGGGPAWNYYNDAPGGGGYGGAGGIGFGAGYAGPTYVGSEIIGGSGGGATWQGNGYGTLGGGGGGAFKLQTNNTIQINSSGIIRANGSDGQAQPNFYHPGWAGGSGGRISVYGGDIIVAAGGVISANGGNGGTQGGSGGGGKVAVYYRTITNNGSISANKGSSGWRLGNNGAITYSIYSSSGTFESATIDLGAKANLSTLDFASTIPAQSQTSCTASTGAGCALKFQVATNNDNSTWTYLGPDGTANTYFTSTGTAIPSALSGKQYFRYKAYLSTADTAYTPSLDSLTVNYIQYPSTSSVSNLIFNTGYPNVGWSTVSWVRSDTNTASSTIKVKVQARAAATDTALASATFVGYDNTNTNSSTYFDKFGANCSEAAGKWGDTAGDNATKKTVTCYIDGADATYLNPTATSNQWLELKLVLEGDIANTPIIDAVRATYSINNEPQICAKLDLATDSTGQTCDNTITTIRQSDGTSEVVQSQSPTTYGRVIFNTYLRDPDTDASSVELNKGKMLIALEYSDASGNFSQAAPPSINGGYYNAGNFATAANLTLTPNESGFAACEASGRTDAFKYLCSIYRDDTGTSGTNEANKYSGYSVNWNAKGDVPSAYTATRKVRVIAYDQEGANSVTGVTPATSINFIFDTTNPTGSAVANAKDNSLALSVNDEGLVYYKLSHDNVTWTPSDETSWTGPVSGAISWTYQEPGDRTSKVYYRLRDAYGNEKSVTSVSTPQRPTNIILQDVSNVKASPASYKNFLSWEVVSTPPSGAGFARYDVYRCTPTETDPSCAEVTNYTIVNAGQNTSISDNSYTDGNVTANGTYYYHIAAKDNDGNISKWSDQNAGAAANPIYGKANGTQDFGEGGGGGDTIPPTISVFSVTDKTQTSAKVIWTTNDLATGGVFYSTNTSYNSEKSTLSYQTAGYDSVDAPSGRAINITGLDANKTYNIQLKSTDASGNITVCDGSSSPSTTADGSGKVTAINDTSYCPSGATYSFATLEKDVTPAIISGITITEVTHNSAKVSWSTNEDSDSCAGYDYADTGRDYKTEQCDSTQTQSHSVTLGGLSPTTTYYIKLKSRDSSDNLSSNCSTESKTDCPDESNFSFLTAITPVPTVSVSGGGGGGKTDFSAPDISNVKVSDITKDSATITWRTSEAASSLVQYGKTENLLSATGGQIDSEFDHKVVLRGLENDTKYFFKANSIDWAGNIGVSEAQSFATKKAPSIIEEIQGTEEQKVKTTEVLKQLEEQIKAQKEGIVDPLQTLLDALSPLVPEPIIIGESPEIEVNSTFATIKWRTDKKSTSFVALSREDEFDSASQEPYKLTIGNPDDSVKEHIVEVANLLPATKYHYQVRSKALLGNTSESKDFTFTTKSELPQIVSFLQKKTENEKTAVIYWETSIPTDSVVKYTPYVKGKLSPKDAKLQGKPDMVGDHEITLTNLDPGTIYQIEISGKDPFGNQTSKVLPDFTTAIDKDAPVISQVRIESAMISGKTPKIQTIISYRTDEPATSQVYYAEGGSDKFKQLTPDLNLSTIHTSVVTDFKPASIYRIKIESTDESGNLATSRDFTILTPAQSQSIIDIIIKTFENTFGWVKNIKF